MTVTISAPELARLNRPLLLDVRWKLGDDRGHEHYLDAHIPGAVYVDLETELAAPASPEAGRHPLPDIADLQKSVRAWGIHPESTVVVYDDNAGQSAARLWWLLRWAGIADVRLLDGGLGAWRAAGLPVAGGAEAAAGGGTAVVTPGGLPTVTADDVAAGGALLLDARAGERYRGEVEPVDPRAGHIPGAVSAPTADNVGPDGLFLPADRLRERFAGLGVRDDADVTVYCGSGVTAAHQIAALASIGVTAALYPGSWSQWSADPARPGAVGAS
ncbi:sulfurtransferase [Tsukamurella sp. NPDC003166]|uniref:sulfurtransferase n=1 Tax=Tsukamurella sp. NPDC003166 TaxID=3154444 RepID=UPI0033AE20D0